MTVESILSVINSDDETFEEFRKEFSLPGSSEQADPELSQVSIVESELKSEKNHDYTVPLCPIPSLKEDTVEPEELIFNPKDFESLADFVQIGDNGNVDSFGVLKCESSVGSTSGSFRKSSTSFDQATCSNGLDSSFIKRLTRSLNSLRYSTSSSEKSLVFSELNCLSSQSTSPPNSRAISLFSIDESEEILHVEVPKHMRSHKMIRYISPKADKSLAQGKGWKRTKCYKPDRYIDRVNFDSHHVRFGAAPRIKTFLDIQISFSECGGYLQKILTKTGEKEEEKTDIHNPHGQELVSILKSRNDNTRELGDLKDSSSVEDEDSRVRYNFDLMVQNTKLNKCLSNSEKGEVLQNEFVSRATEKQYKRLLHNRLAREKISTMNRNLFF